MAKPDKLNKIYKSYAEICVPAALYFIVGLGVVAIEFYYYTQELVKTKQEIMFLSAKLVVIVLVTIALNYLCHAGYTFVSVIIMLVTTGYLLIDEFRAIKERRSMSPVHYVRQAAAPLEAFEPMTNAFDTPVSATPLPIHPVMDESEYRLKQIVPMAQLIGQSTKNAYN